MEKRRISFMIGVTYETSATKLKKIPGFVKKAIKPIKKATFNRAHLKSYGPSSLDYEVVYYVSSNDYLTYMDIQEKINLALIEEFKKEKIEFAYPTQTCYMHKTA